MTNDPLMPRRKERARPQRLTGNGGRDAHESRLERQTALARHVVAGGAKGIAREP
jgi:hypothetical protein